MRIKQTVILGIFALSAVFAQAQTTPEAIIAQCPQLPSASQLAADESPVVKAFFAKIKTLRETQNAFTNTTVETAMKADVEAIAKKMTGKSVSELQNMSGAEAEALGKRMADQALANAGLGNMSIADLQALEGKSDAEIMAAMSGAKIKTPSAAQQRETQTQVKNAEETRKINEQWQYIRNLNSKETLEVAKKIAEITAKYDAQIAAVPRSQVEKDGVYPTKAEQKKIESLSNACNVECYTLWINQITKMQGRLKTMLPDADRLDKIINQQMASSGMTQTAKQKMRATAWGIAGDYLDMAESVTSLPRVEN